MKLDGVPTLTSNNHDFFVKGKHSLTIDCLTLALVTVIAAIGILLLDNNTLVVVRFGWFLVASGFIVLFAWIRFWVNIKHSFIQIDGQRLTFAYSKRKIYSLDLDSIEKIFITTEDDIYFVTSNGRFRAPLIMSNSEQRELLMLLEGYKKVAGANVTAGR